MKIVKMEQMPLFIGGLSCVLASVLHILIIIGGADWYRFFGAGEEAAQSIEQGSISTTLLTVFIATILGLIGILALLSATKNIRIILEKTLWLFVTTVFIVRGVIGIPLVIMISNPYLDELKDRMLFVIVTSIISLGIGISFLLGFLRKVKESHNKEVGTTNFRSTSNSTSL